MSFDDETIIAGFILNKLYLGHYFARPNNLRHGRHTDVDNMPKGYDPKYKGSFKKVIRNLEKSGLVVVFPSAGSRHICAILTNEAITNGLRYCNAHRKLVSLPSLDRNFKELKNRS